MFAPDGTVLQVSRANMAVNRANTILGVCGLDGVVLAAEVNATYHFPGHELLEDKIYKIDDQIVVGCAGIAADANFLVEQMRLIAQRYKSCYDSSIPVEILVKNICDIKQAYTQYAHRRPFGVSIIYIGYDRHQLFQLYKSEPDGSYDNWYGTCVGNNCSICLNIINNMYNSYRTSVVDIKSARLIAVHTFLKLSQQNDNFGNIIEKVKIVFISSENGTPEINFLSKEDIQEVLSEVPHNL